MAVVPQRLEDGGAAAHLFHLRVKRLVLFEIDEFVDDEAEQSGPRHAIVRVAALLPGFHVLAVPLPEIGGSSLVPL